MIAGPRHHRISLLCPQGTDWVHYLAIGGISVVAQFFLTGAFVTTQRCSGSLLAIRWRILVPSMGS